MIYIKNLVFQLAVNQSYFELSNYIKHPNSIPNFIMIFQISPYSISFIAQIIRLKIIYIKEIVDLYYFADKIIF